MDWAQLPPLSALRVFAAAARLGSFTRAAQSLNLTQSGVSHQIRLLEARLGTALFERVGRGVVLTKAGAELAATVGDALTRMQEACARIARHSADGDQVTLATFFTLAAKWLVPRLAQLPDGLLPPRILASTSLTDLAAGEADLALRHGLPDDPSLTGGGMTAGGLICRDLGDEAVFPVAVPDLAARLTGPKDLARQTLLEDEGINLFRDQPDWPGWAQRVGVDLAAARRRRFNSTLLAYEAALDGQGVALGRMPLVARDLAAGRLVRLPLWPQGSGGGACRSDRRYFLVLAAEARRRPAVRRLAEWLESEFQGSKDGDNQPPVSSP